MSWLNNTNWPWTFKILVAPIVDGLPLFGMRKYHRRGFIAGAGIVAAFLLFALAWDYKNLVNKESCANGFGLWVYIILAVFMASVQDVALDGLTIIALAGRNIGYGAALQGFGKKFGQDGGKAMILILNKTFNLPVCRQLPQYISHLSLARQWFKNVAAGESKVGYAGMSEGLKIWGGLRVEGRGSSN